MKNELKTSSARLEFVDDKNKSIYAWTEDGPYLLMVAPNESRLLQNNQIVQVTYKKYGQCASLEE